MPELDIDRIRELYSEIKWYRRYYQDIPELHLNKSERKNDRRVIDLQLSRIDFAGKVVWDLGCAGGFFLRYAIDLGAKKAIGFDLPYIVERVTEVNKFLGYPQIVFYGVDIDSLYDTEFFDEIDAPDIVFYLSMNYHVRFPRAIIKHAETIVFEDNGHHSMTRPDKIPEIFTKNFRDIEYIGRSTDHEPTTIYHIRKGQ
jgi:2-polyprenyl-3-methyl-5-hydroxy-6-metoxy-1,4-benzoquinol methylase